MATGTSFKPSWRQSVGRSVVALLITYVVARLIFRAIGFRYDVFSDAFDLGKLLLDLGLWVAVFTVTAWLLNTWPPSRDRR